MEFLGSWSGTLVRDEYKGYEQVTALHDRQGAGCTAHARRKYDELLNQAEYETDVQKRLDLLAQAEGILLQDAPLIPLYHYVNKYAFRDNVKGIPLNPRNMVVFKNVTAGR